MSENALTEERQGLIMDTPKEDGGATSPAERQLVLDPQDEIIAACCRALNKAHSLLDVIARYEGKVQTPEFVAACKAWVEDEFDPGTQTARPCVHNWRKALLDNSMHCTRCGITMSQECH